MKFYDCKSAPSPRRARMFIAEKGIDIETLEVDLGKQEQLGDAFREINPRCTVPVLELDDGTRLTENAAIAAYLEAQYPDPPLLGRTPSDIGTIANWNTRVELEGLWPLADVLRNESRGMADRAITGPTNYAQIPALAERGRAQGAEFFEVLNERLGESNYVGGDHFSVADITALVVVDFAGWVKLGPAEDHEHTRKWHTGVSQRPSASL